MPDAKDHLRHTKHEQVAAHPNRAEIADLLQDSGSSEGINLEWIYDRFGHVRTVTTEQS